MAVKCRSGAYRNQLGSFYYSLGGESGDINRIGLDICSLIFNNDLNEWNKVKKELNEAKDREGNQIDMTVVGISTGLFIPTRTNKSRDWYYLGDKKALEHGVKYRIDLTSQNRL